MALTPVPVALRALLDSVPGRTPIETLPLAQCAWRVLGADLAALRTQPPFANSAMDGYAVRAADIAAALIIIFASVISRTTGRSVSSTSQPSATQVSPAAGVPVRFRSEGLG